MKQKKTMSSTQLCETPIVRENLLKPDKEKIELIKTKFQEIMEILGLDLSDHSLKDTPSRVANMYVKEIFSGLNPKNKPKVTLFDNTYNYDQMVVEKDITFYSNCEHHFVPFFGKAHIAYISSGKVIGLSKMNRLVQYYSKRPQVQERLTVQIAAAIQHALKTEDIGVVVDATHMCVCSRGIKDTNSTTGTSCFLGQFKTDQCIKNEFLNFINSSY